MLCYVMLCYVMLYYVLSNFNLYYCVTLRYVTLCYVVLCISQLSKQASCLGRFGQLFLHISCTLFLLCRSIKHLIPLGKSGVGY